MHGGHHVAHKNGWLTAEGAARAVGSRAVAEGRGGRAGVGLHKWGSGRAAPVAGGRTVPPLPALAQPAAETDSPRHLHCHGIGLSRH